MYISCITLRIARHTVFTCYSIATVRPNEKVKKLMFLVTAFFTIIINGSE